MSRYNSQREHVGCTGLPPATQNADHKTRRCRLRQSRRLLPCIEACRHAKLKSHATLLAPLERAPARDMKVWLAAQAKSRQVLKAAISGVYCESPRMATVGRKRGLPRRSRSRWRGAEVICRQPSWRFRARSVATRLSVPTAWRPNHRWVSSHDRRNRTCAGRRVVGQAYSRPASSARHFGSTLTKEERPVIRIGQVYARI
jgi:hypothetical protein